MKSNLNSKLQQRILAAICAAVVLTFCKVNAQSYGIKFLGNTSDPVTGSAGVVSISGWNNIANGTFNSGTVLSSDGLSSATLTLAGTAAHNTWRSTGGVMTGGNDSLMNGYMDVTQGSSSTITLSGLASGGLFNVFLYTFADQTRPSNGGDLMPNYSVNGTTYYMPVLGVGTSTFDATSATVGGPFSSFVQGTTYNANFNTATANASDFGNYLEIMNVSAVGGVITIGGGPDTTTWRSPLNGFEIAAAPVPEPSTVALSAISGLAMLKIIRRRNK